MIEQVGLNGPPNGQATVSTHELHNLIAVIIAEAQLLQLDAAEEAPIHQSAETIERAGRRLELLIDQLAALRNANIASRPNQVRKPSTETDTSGQPPV